MVGKSFPFPVAINSRPVLSAIVSPPFPPRYHLQTFGRRDFASGLETVDTRYPIYSLQRLPV